MSPHDIKSATGFYGAFQFVLITGSCPSRTRADINHAKKYADFAAEYDRLQQMRVEAMSRYVADVHDGDYPAPQHLVDCDAAVVNAFRDWLDGQ